MGLGDASMACERNRDAETRSVDEKMKIDQETPHAQSEG